MTKGATVWWDPIYYDCEVPWVGKRLLSSCLYTCPGNIFGVLIPESLLDLQVTLQIETGGKFAL